MVRLNSTAISTAMITSGLNLGELSRKTRIAAKTIRRSLKGLPIHVDSARKLCAGLGVNPADVLNQPSNVAN